MHIFAYNSTYLGLFIGNNFNLRIYFDVLLHIFEVIETKHFDEYF